MMRLANACALLVPSIVIASAASGQHTEPRDEAAVRAVLQHYIAGHATGDGSHMAMIFHPESRLFWMRDGRLNSRTSTDYIGGFSGEPAADEPERRRRIVMVDVSGDAAVAKIELDYPGAYIVDYMSLLKIDGEWKIVNKIFTVEQRR